MSQKWNQKTEIKWVRETDNFILGSPDPTTSGVSKEKSEIYKPQSTKRYFEYEIVIKNDSNLKIIGIELDYVFLYGQGKMEKVPNNFILTETIKPNKKLTLKGRTFNPPNITINAKDYEDENTKPKEVVEINCIVFEDRTFWKREGFDEKVCEDLLNQIKKRGEKSKKN